MTPLTPLFPRQPAPELKVPTVDGPAWRLAERKPKNFTMVVFYRGLHCPICSRYLADLESKLDAFAERGVEAIAISSDVAEGAAEAKGKWKLPRLTVGYGLGLADARRWGLYISSSKGKTSAGIDEPPLFAEPGLYLVRADGTLYFGSVQTMPFARPAFGDILQATDFVIKNDYPARGEVTDYTRAA